MRRTSLTLVASALCLGSALLVPVRTRAVEAVGTEYGLVQGIAEKDLTVYRGIPFAAPPVGDLRWRAPHPAAT